MHEVGGRVVAHGGRAQIGVHMGLHRIAHTELTTLQFAMVAKHIGLDLLRVLHMELRAAVVDQALVADLAAGLGVERGGV